MSNYGPPPRQEQSFFGALFDLSFTTFVTTKIIKVLYIISMVIVGIYALFFIGAGFSNSAGAGVAALIFSPLFALFGLIYARVLLEFVVVVFRIGEHTATMAQSLSGGAPQGGWSPQAPTPYPAAQPDPPPPPATPSPGWGPPPEPGADDPTRRLGDGPGPDDAPGGRSDVPPPPT